jgi:hypothetical protein
MKHTAYWVTLAGTAIFALGCGGGSGSIPTCGVFQACGGDLTGTWTFDGMCGEGDIATSMMDTSGLPPECSDIIKSFSMNISGTLIYANGTETSDVNMTMTARAVYSSACINAEAGTSVAVSQALCDAMSSGMSSTDGPTMTCKLASGGCDCNMTMSQSAQESDTYTVSGSTLTYSGGDTIEFCVSGTKLTVRPTPDPGAPAMQFQLHRS